MDNKQLVENYKYHALLVAANSTRNAAPIYQFNPNLDIKKLNRAINQAARDEEVLDGSNKDVPHALSIMELAQKIRESKLVDYSLFFDATVILDTGAELPKAFPSEDGKRTNVVYVPAWRKRIDWAKGKTPLYLVAFMTDDDNSMMHIARYQFFSIRFPWFETKMFSYFNEKTFSTEIMKSMTKSALEAHKTTPRHMEMVWEKEHEDFIPVRLMYSVFDSFHTYLDTEEGDKITEKFIVEYKKFFDDVCIPSEEKVEDESNELSDVE